MKTRAVKSTVESIGFTDHCLQEPREKPSMKMLEYTNNLQQATNNSKNDEIWGFVPQHTSLGFQLPLPMSSEATAGDLSGASSCENKCRENSPLCITELPLCSWSRIPAPDSSLTHQSPSLALQPDQEQLRHFLGKVKHTHESTARSLPGEQKSMQSL